MLSIKLSVNSGKGYVAATPETEPGENVRSLEISTPEETTTTAKHFVFVFLLFALLSTQTYLQPACLPYGGVSEKSVIKVRFDGH